MCVLAETVTTRSDDHLCAEFKYFANVKTAVSVFMESPGVNISFFEKALDGSGDLASIAILQMYSDEYLRSEARANQTLVIVRMAFSYPHLIQRSQNRKPRFTVLLLDHLQQLNSESELRLQIARTKAYISAQTKMHSKRH